MRVYKKQFDILRWAKETVEFCFPHFGMNKRREIKRLLYEISKRENISPEAILGGTDFRSFAKVKTYLLKRRFPYAYCHNELGRPYLPKIELNPKACVAKKKRLSFYPKNIFVEAAAKKSHLAEKFKKSFPDSTFIEIKTLKDYASRQKRRFKIKDYNNRRDALFIVNEKQDFFKMCPCTKGAYGCAYHIFNLSFGCIFECTYCYLQEYTNSPGIILPANFDKFFDTFNSYKKRGMRIGTGEFSDSLMLDDLTQYSAALIDFFNKHRDVLFEFKTKSDKIENLLKLKHSGNIVVSWSLNPQRIINENEFFTSTLTERINSASRCAQAGYRLGFHFDPVIYFKGWEKHYERVVEMLFAKIMPKDISWISIGTLRFSPGLKRIIEMRFPDTGILNEELVLGYDNKLRYPHSIRYNVYKTLIQKMQKYSGKLPIYLCMEDKSIWRDLKLTNPFNKPI